MGLFVTAVFLKLPGYVYAAPYAVSCKVSEVVNHPLCMHSYPHGPARLLILRFDHPTLAWTALNYNAVIAEQCWEEALFFFPLEQKPCCPAAHKEFHGSLLTAPSSACSTQDKTEVPLARAASEEGISCGSLCSQPERNKITEHVR